MANKTIGELQAVPIGELPVAPDIYDETLIPVEQNGAARHMTGAQWKAYGVAAAKAEADRAAAAAARQPIIGTGGTWLVWDKQEGAYVDTGLPARGEQGGKGDKGDPGEPGKDGITPRIGANGHWWVGDTDTGVEATAGAAAAQEAADRAEDAAAEAGSAASRASGYASTAARQADNASDYASDAAASATSAAKKAAAAEAAADDANLAQTAAISAQTAAEKAQAAAESAAIKQPKLSANNTWMIWDASAKEYVDTGLSAVGPQGPAGAGSGDMLASVYDPQGKRKDIFKYVDDQILTLDIDVTADEVTFADGETFQQKYESGELTGPEGPQGPQGPQGPAGGDGKDGKDGADGYTPVAGKDYFTPTDKQEMVAAVLAALPAAEGAKF